MRNWVAELTTTEACVDALSKAQRDWQTAHHNDRNDAGDEALALSAELLERYWQVGGTALQVGDLIDPQGNVRSPEDIISNTRAAAIALQQVGYLSGYILGLGRGNEGYGLADETHVYEKVNQGEPGRPMCYRGWNRDFGTGYSIFRGNVGTIGVCPICLVRIEMGLSPVEAAPEPAVFYSSPDTTLWNADYTPLRLGFSLMAEELQVTNEQYAEA